MPDGDRYPTFISQKFDQAQKCLAQAPDLVGQAVAATVIKDFKRDLKTLGSLFERFTNALQDFLHLGVEERSTHCFGFEQTFANRNEKLLARAALKLANGRFADAQNVSVVETWFELGKTYLVQQVQASFVSPAQVRVQQGTQMSDEQFDATLTRALREAETIFDERLEAWSQCRDPNAIKPVAVPSVKTPSTQEILEGNDYETELTEGSLNNEQAEDA
jgi:hypothetical protein